MLSVNIGFTVIKFISKKKKFPSVFSNTVNNDRYNPQ